MIFLISISALFLTITNVGITALFSIDKTDVDSIQKSRTTVFLTVAHYLVCTICTVGYDNTFAFNIESYIFFLVAMFIGVLFFGYISSSIKLAVAKLQDYDDVLEEQIDEFTSWSIIREKKIKQVSSSINQVLEYVQSTSISAIVNPIKYMNSDFYN
jgi:hypothetical protein